MGPEALAQVLRQLRDSPGAPFDPNLLVGLAVSDDAAVYRVNDSTAVILTVDFFTPVVDDPYEYGAIAAANSMSDVYAMGGKVAIALNVCAFPPSLPPGVIAGILQGGKDKVTEAGGIIAGGHTVDDKEPKYGLCVMGFVAPDRILTKGGARPGDALVLTKPLGVAMITTAFKGDAADPADVRAAVRSMTRLNRGASECAQEIGVHSCTDVTGYSLLGHAQEMAERSKARLAFRFADLPFLPGAVGYAEQSLFCGGSSRNRDHFQGHVDFSPRLSEEMRLLLFSPETSGGLLVAVARERLDALQSALRKRGEPFWIVGEAREGQGIEVRD